MTVGTAAEALTVEQLAELILEQTRQDMTAGGLSSAQIDWERVEVRPGPKYTKIDRGPQHNMSGMLMIENATGDIFGIKGYGKVNRAHRYGTLATTGEWYWGSYYPQQRSA